MGPARPLVLLLCAALLVTVTAFVTLPSSPGRPRHRRHVITTMTGGHKHHHHPKHKQQQHHHHHRGGGRSRHQHLKHAAGVASAATGLSLWPMVGEDSGGGGGVVGATDSGLPRGASLLVAAVKSSSLAEARDAAMNVKGCLTGDKDMQKAAAKGDWATVRVCG